METAQAVVAKLFITCDCAPAWELQTGKLLAVVYGVIVKGFVEHTAGLCRTSFRWF